MCAYAPLHSTALFKAASRLREKFNYKRPFGVSPSLSNISHPPSSDQSLVAAQIHFERQQREGGDTRRDTAGQLLTSRVLIAVVLVGYSLSCRRRCSLYRSVRW